MRLVLLLLVFFISLISSAQKTVDVGKQDVNVIDPNFFFAVNGQPFVNAKFVKIVQGSPYFRDDWMQGSVMLNGGKAYFNNNLKLELVTNELHFIDTSNVEMIATGILKQIKLVDTVSQTIYTFIHSAFINGENIPGGWYELLADGKPASLFKQHVKSIVEVKPYGSATYEQLIETYERRMLLLNKNFTEIKNIKDLSNMFADKKNEVQQYIKDHNLSSKSDNDLVQVVNYYNSLHQ